MARVYLPVTRFAARAAGPADRVADFMAHLRANGMAQGVTDTNTALAALTVINAHDVDETRAALKAVCTNSADEFARFDDLFTAYWHNRGRERQGQAKASTSERQRSSTVADADGTAGTGRADRPDTNGAGDAEQSGTGRLTGSRAANLMRMDLREIVTPADMHAAEDAAGGRTGAARRSICAVSSAPALPPGANPCACTGVPAPTAR
jgi:uncharacterized protein